MYIVEVQSSLWNAETYHSSNARASRFCNGHVASLRRPINGHHTIFCKFYCIIMYK